MNKKNVFRVLLLAITVFGFLNFSSSKNETEDFSEKVKVALREVGNQLLLAQKDSTSLVLPIKEITVNKYAISFEKELSFQPNILVNIVKSVFNKSSLSTNYRVEVIRCLDKEVAYSYEINELEEQTIIPCAGRELPINCYQIELRFLKKSSSNNSWLLYIFIPLILGILYRLFFNNQENDKVEEESTKNHTVLGSFQFYPEQNKLVKKASEIPLSKKECELLEIFVANPNQTIKREELTKKVWEDNGVFVGRSLDTYISKLRKKLQEDKNIKLTNIHGVGYKLEIK
ncbi:winged helix-turn-helix domain-containing protein [Polaribacter sp. Z022]|uniref:winged helix-turn-helix domain-containing protein n=1 Tax=Polaribacter sp. Z022 TaxID=2927125 RepID=UPI00202256A1|nr:winged helix-turn-helix domain-containing protein [Polaribacter sp. Z022]MCL7752393.1 winged helix-turn-helix domain-containing protein [Polaribacter sp. Z022]